MISRTTIEIAAAFLIGFVIGRHSALRAQEGGIKTEVIETTVRDTIRLKSPPLSASKITNYVIVPVRDTVRICDTLYQALPRETREYRDTSFRAVVSGYDPRLEEIDIFGATRTVRQTVREPRPRWGVSVTAGPGLLLDTGGHLHGGAGLVIGISYNF